MKKNLLAFSIGFTLIFPLYGYAAEDISTTTNSSSDKTTEGTSTEILTPAKLFTLCSQAAIEKRDTKIASTRMTYNNIMTSALTERKNREKAAIAMSDEDTQKAALKTSVETYKNQVKSAQTTLTQARKTIWQAFDTDIKKCRDTQETSDTQAGALETESVSRKIEEASTKGFKETFKLQIESLRSLFN